MPQKSGIRIQSAMEYLMTYGWAILVISVVLGGMFALGVFNPTTFLAKAQPGACQVIRTNGPNTTMFISTSGLCNGQLPQFIATFSGNGAYANLGNSISESPENGATGAMTLCTWYLVNSLTGYVGVALKGESSPSNGNSWEYTIDPAGTSQGFAVYPPTGTPFLPPSPIASYSTGSQPTTGKWYFACFTYNYAKSSAYYYLNGQQYTATFVGGLPASTGTGNFIVGGGNSGYSQVWMSNVQLYNASLSSNEISSMYTEGIGGAPIQLQNLVGWWPLNQNVQDYSGDNLNGTANSIGYTSNWESTYTPT